MPLDFIVSAAIGLDMDNIPEVHMQRLRVQDRGISRCCGLTTGDVWEYVVRSLKGWWDPVHYFSFTAPGEKVVLTQRAYPGFIICCAYRAEHCAFPPPKLIKRNLFFFRT